MSLEISSSFLLESYRKRLDWFTPYDEYRRIVREWGLRIVYSADRFPPDLECGNFVLGPGIRHGHEYDFAGHGQWSEEFIYGALAQYGYYTVEKNASEEKDSHRPALNRERSAFLLQKKLREPIHTTTFLTIEEAFALKKFGYKVPFQATHIGMTTPRRTVISKWGTGECGDVVEHPPLLCPDMFGELEYVSFSCEVYDRWGLLQKVYIMPVYQYFPDGKYNLELRLTDEKKDLGKIRGVLEGEIGTDRSAFIITQCYNETHGDIPHLITSVVAHLDKTVPAIAMMNWMDLERPIEGERIPHEFIKEYSL